MELKLTNVARASLEELRLDYEDFLRQRELRLWPIDDPRRQELVQRRPKSAEEVADWARFVRGDGRNGQPEEGGSSIQSIKSIQSIYPEIAANGALALIGVVCSLLDRQIKSLARAFESDGGFTERLYNKRKASKLSS